MLACVVSYFRSITNQAISGANPPRRVGCRHRHNLLMVPAFHYFTPKSEPTLMAFPIYRNGKILFRNGKPAFSTKCCCKTGCCTYTGDESVVNLRGDYGDIIMTQTGASTLVSGLDGQCANREGGIKFTVPVQLEEALYFESYTTTVTITLLTPSAVGCRWLVEIPQDPEGRFSLAHSGYYIAGMHCIGEQQNTAPGGEVSGWGIGVFEVLDPDNSAAGEQCKVTDTVDS